MTLVACERCLALLFALCVVVALLYAIRAGRLYLFHARLKRARRADEYADFLRYFAPEGVPDHLVRAVYVVLSSEVALVREFPVRPDDSLHDVYGVCGFSGTDMDEVLDSVGARCGVEPCSIPFTVSIETVADLVRLVASVIANRDGGLRAVARPGVAGERDVSHPEPPGVTSVKVAE